MTGTSDAGRTEIRFARPDDREALLGFLENHWSRTHVFVRAPELFDWQYGLGREALNMVLASNGETVHGVLGFIPTGRFDSELGSLDIMLSVWKAQPDAPPGIGLFLLKTIQARLRPRLVGAIGITDEVKPFYRALGYSLDVLHHSAIFNPTRRDQRIADGVPVSAFSAQIDDRRIDRTMQCLSATQVHGLGKVLDQLGGKTVPVKSSAYVVERYVRHPWYEYQYALICLDGIAEALCIWREITVGDARVLRIVDIVGDTAWLADGRGLLLPLLESANADYIDVMQIGTAPSVLAQGGWLSPDTCPGLILPNYFAPFERRNIAISCAWKLSGELDLPLRLYRADSDQDRPNAVPLPVRRDASSMTGQ